MLLTSLLFAAVAADLSVNKRTLTTPNYVVTITQRCAEYEVGCSKVQYEAVSRFGKSITLQGKQVMAMCKDGVTPCHSLGYRFEHEGATYSVSEGGELTVTKGSKTLVDEKGKWQGD